MVDTGAGISLMSASDAPNGGIRPSDTVYRPIAANNTPIVVLGVARVTICIGGLEMERDVVVVNEIEAGSILIGNDINTTYELQICFKVSKLRF